MIDERLKDKLTAMTWDGLREWSDPKSVERGKGYLEEVEAPAVFADGSLVSEVHGSDDYYTKLSVDANSELQGECTCPVGHRCKHCVALALVAAKMLKSGTAIADAKMSNRRWKTAAEELSYLKRLDDDVEDEPFDDASESEIDPVPNYVAGLNSEDLRRLVSELLENVPSARMFVQQKIPVDAVPEKPKKPLRKRTVKDIVHEAREAISFATSGWYDPWDHDDGYDEVPDYSDVLECFKELKVAGEWRELMELAKKLKKRGEQQAEQSHDEGEISSQVSECMDVVVEAVMEQGDMDVLEKLKWEEQLRDKDNYAILSDMKSSWATSLQASDADWQRVIDAVTAKYENERQKRTWKARYLLYDLAVVMERLGKLDRAVEMLRETISEDPRGYVKLVDLFERHERHDEAAAVCRQGLAVRPSLNCDYELRERLQKIACATNDPKIIAAQALDDFLSHPYESTYRELKKACETLGAWERVRDFVLRHYETGAKIADQKKWPLAKIEMTACEEKVSFPCAGVLTDIALHEKRMNDVVKWYRVLTHDGKNISYSHGWNGDRNEEVADAVAKIAPELSVKIWEKKIFANCEKPDRSCYANIGAALRKLRPLLESIGRVGEWHQIIERLRTEYKRRSSLMSILNQIDREKGGLGKIADDELQKKG